MVNKEGIKLLSVDFVVKNNKIVHKLVIKNNLDLMKKNVTSNYH